MSWRKEIPDTYKVEDRPKTTDDLLSDLRMNNIDTPTHFVKKNLIDLATKHGKPLNKTVEKGVAKTWLHQPKGMLQVAWERGLLDFDSYCVEDFSVKGKLDEMGNRIAATNLSLLIAGCEDFLTEVSLLQLNLQLLGVTCIHSPKYHCEIAGEGIEYSWGNSKVKYRRISCVKDKKSIDQFQKSTWECLSQEYLTIDRI